MVGGVQILCTHCSQVSWPLRISISTLKIVDGNLQRIDDRKADGVFLGGDHRTNVPANASLQELAEFLFRIPMVIGKVARQLDFCSQLPEAFLEALRSGNPAQASQCRAL